MDKIFEKRLYYDFYSDLLTPRQREVLNLYYNEDLNLKEIADRLGSTRQAVFDLIKRTNRSLKLYESKLNLVNHEIKENEVLSRVKRNLETLLKTSTVDKDKKILEDSIDLLDEVIKE